MSLLSPLLLSPVTGSRPAEVAQRISEAIYLGLLGDGERLPTEIDLATQFGVAPMTVRDALSELRERRLVETRRGRNGGSFVVRPDSPPVEPVLAALRSTTLSELRDLGDEHQAVGGQSASFAAERASPANVRRLFALTDQLAVVETVGDRIRADSRFHIELAVASYSTRLTRREVAIQAEVSGMLWIPVGLEVDTSKVVAEHHEIARAVAAEDKIAARALMEAHLVGNTERLVSLYLLLAEGS